MFFEWNPEVRYSDDFYPELIQDEFLTNTFKEHMCVALPHAVSSLDKNTVKCIRDNCKERFKIDIFDLYSNTQFETVLGIRSGQKKNRIFVIFGHILKSQVVLRLTVQ